MSITSSALPTLPYPEFPLRPHRNGSWYKTIWNRHTKKSEQFYFGSWRDDPKGERAMTDPEIGWLARRDAIKAGIDNPRVTALSSDELTLGELMARFLVFKRDKAKAGELSMVTLGDYLSEIELFVTFMKPATPAARLKPEHFAGYMQHLIEVRKLGRHARKRVRAYAPLPRCVILSPLPLFPPTHAVQKYALLLVATSPLACHAASCPQPW